MQSAVYTCFKLFLFDMAICFGIIQFEDIRSRVCIFPCKLSVLKFCKYTEYNIDKKDHLCEEKIAVPGWARTTNLSVNSRTR